MGSSLAGILLCGSFGTMASGPICLRALFVQGCHPRVMTQLPPEVAVPLLLLLLRQGMFDQGFMQQMMQSPMMQQMLSNPDNMRNMLQMNPAVREVGTYAGTADSSCGLLRMCGICSSCAEPGSSRHLCEQQSSCGGPLLSVHAAQRMHACTPHQALRLYKVLGPTRPVCVDSIPP